LTNLLPGPFHRPSCSLTEATTSIRCPDQQPSQRSAASWGSFRPQICRILAWSVQSSPSPARSFRFNLTPVFLRCRHKSGIATPSIWESSSCDLTRLDSTLLDPNPFVALLLPAYTHPPSLHRHVRAKPPACLMTRWSYRPYFSTPPPNSTTAALPICSSGLSR
jgi:hypothetical protein